MRKNSPWRSMVVLAAAMLVWGLDGAAKAQEEAAEAPEGAGKTPEEAGKTREEAAEAPEEAEGVEVEVEVEEAPAEGGEAGAVEGGMDLKVPEGGYDLKLKSLEEKVNELKEKIFRSKARLILLQETVLHGEISGAKARLIHRNEMGSSFRLVEMRYALDGIPIFNKVDVEGSLDEQEEIELYDGNITPGNHQVSVFLIYRGHGFGIFSYLKGYRFKIRSSYTFYAEEGKTTVVKVVGFEKGGMTTDLKDRPSVRYDVEIREGTKAGPQKPLKERVEG